MSIDTLAAGMAVLSVTVAGVAALPWSQREVTESARAFTALGRWMVEGWLRLTGARAPVRVAAHR
jgi:hypothetical protein